MSVIGKLKNALWGYVAQQLVRPLAKTPTVFGDPSKLRIAPSARVVNALFNTQSGTIEVGSYVFFGHGVLLLTGSHDLTKRGAERQNAIVPEGRDIVIEEGAWLNSNVVILGPCHIGRNAVVLAGSVVRSDVPADTIFGGVPARRIGVAGVGRDEL